MIIAILIIVIFLNVIYILVEAFPSVFRTKHHRAAMNIYLRDEYEVVGSSSDSKMKLWILKNDIEPNVMPVITRHHKPIFKEWDFHIYNENEPDTVMMYSPIDPLAVKIIKKLKPVIEEYERKNSL